MRLRPLFLFLGACAGVPPTGVPAPTPAAPPSDVVLALPPGTAIATEVAGDLPDAPRFRALVVWWREALRPTVAFELLDEADPRDDVARLVLAVDPEAATLAALLRTGAEERVLAGGTFADGDLPAAIDRVALRTRQALGERATAPVPVAASTSPHPEVATALADAALLLRDGGVQAARRLLVAARAKDGGSPAVLDGLAAVELLRGDDAAAEKLCSEALGYAARLQPTTEHRLARTLLLARASRDPTRAAERDRELLALGEAIQRERPFDLHGRLSLAIARNFTADFAAARSLLESLRTAMPEQPIVAYHLGMACLGLGDGAAAAAQFDAAALRLPLVWVAVPRLLAHHMAGDEAGVRTLLEEFADEARLGRGPLHDVRRMQAAAALLDGRLDAARALLLDDLRWLVQHPSTLERRVGEFAEQGMVLVRIGGAEEMPPMLTALQQQRPIDAVADACAFLAGLCEIARTRTRVETVEARLSRGGDSAWSALLAAFAHELRGEALDMQTELARAARLSDSPLTKALLARSLRAVGRTAEAEALQTALRRELTTIHLRRPLQHPLLGPELAFAFRAE